MPRPLAVWGRAGYVIHLSGAVAEVPGFNLGLIPVLPDGLWELFIGGWLIARGFNVPAVPPERSALPASQTAPIVPSRAATAAA